MGFLGNVLAFGAGYATGAAFGDKPMNKIKETTMQLRGSAVISSTDMRPVSDVMTSTPETVTVDASLTDAAEQMARADIGDVLVVDAKNMLRGIVTDRDIAIRGVAEGRDPRSTLVGDVTTPAVSLEPTATVDEAMELMRRYDIRRVPVVRGGKPIGVVSLGDVSTSRRSRAVLADISAAPANT